LVAIAGDVLNSATNIVVSGTVNLSDSVTIYNATNSGTTTYHINDAVTTLTSALSTPLQVLVLKAASSVTAVSGAATADIDLSGFSGSNVVNLTITGNNVANNISGGAGNDVINAQSGNDVVFAGIGDDTISTGLGIDTVILSTTLALNGSDTVSDFSATDLLIFNFGDTSELVKADLRGNGTGYQAIAAGGTINADTGLVVITTTQGDLTATTARSLALGLVGESNSDQFYLVFSNGVSTAVYRMADTDTDVSNGFETAELLATLTGVTNPSASSAFFPDFV
jgi:Ca2+-binding RTX toxin-like protein